MEYMEYCGIVFLFFTVALLIYGTVLLQDATGIWGQQVDQWSAYYGYGQGYDVYGYGATQDPSLYAYGAYAGYPQYPQPVSISTLAATITV